ncbi:hypothetical protein CDD83_4941 [Cordyceps sp. RAO-2017]|nr:hypothetical protein CDD83_4941 [Cordyceps sp. RAO-2017]
MVLLLLHASLVALVGLVGGCRAGNDKGTDGWETRYTETATAVVEASAATAVTKSPVSHVGGKAFDRLAIIFFENQNFEKARGDPNFAWLATKGVALTNYYGVTHPSQPNYMASVAGDYFGMNHDDFSRAPRSVATVMDLLDERGIAWGLYQEDMPFSGFEGGAWVNRDNGANDYVRKHNPAVLHDSVATWEGRLAQIKNLSLARPGESAFHMDLAARRLPQWMFITPNMTSDGHDTSVTHAGRWARHFLEPLLDDGRFMDRTLVLVTWDESETYAARNRVLGLLLGDAVPPELVGSQDDHFYTHYSQISSVSANWDLPTLGRWDVGANVFQFVGAKTGDTPRRFPSETALQARYWNVSYNGYFHTAGADGLGNGAKGIPSPNLALDRNTHNRRPILASVRDTWSKNPDGASTYYADIIDVPDGLQPPQGWAPDP